MSVDMEYIDTGRSSLCGKSGFINMFCKQVTMEFKISKLKF